MNNMQATVVIIGAGQLGSRHLQSLANTNYRLFVVDPSQDSLNIAESRFKEVNADFKGEISFHTQITDLPAEIDVCIIATSSKVRARVIETLLEQSRVQYLVLEKVLFPSLQEYDHIGNLLETTGTKAWVNCPRRMFPVYNRMREALQGQKIQMQVTGNNWGLGCNGIHIVDLFAFLAGDSNISLNTENLDPVVHESKRPGYVEFTGTMTGTTSKGDFLSMTSNQVEGVSPMLFTITSPKVHFVIQQAGALEISAARPENGWKWERTEEPMLFQSMLTGQFVGELLETGNCGLTSYIESTELHKAFIQCLMTFSGKLENKLVETCPIT